MPHTHLSHDDRKTIASLLWGGKHNESEIAELIGKHPSTVSRELRRRTGPDGVYRPGAANVAAMKLRAEANGLRRKIASGSEVEKVVEEGIRKYWSPEQVAGRYELDHDEKFVSVATIYSFLYRNRKDLIPFLRHGKKRGYRRKYGTKQREKRREEAKKKRIGERPQEANDRARLGDWESDTIVGQEKTEHIVTHADRKSGKLLADRSKGDAGTIRRVIVRRMRTLPKKKRLTDTYDNGIQFAEHEVIERDLDIEIYFANPYHSWERGTNENTNGLLRQFVPKGTYFKNLTQRQLDRYVRLINTRPRKRHGYRTPDEVFNCDSG